MKNPPLSDQEMNDSSPKITLHFIFHQKYFPFQKMGCPPETASGGTESFRVNDSAQESVRLVQASVGCFPPPKNEIGKKFEINVKNEWIFWKFLLKVEDDNDDF